MSTAAERRARTQEREALIVALSLEQQAPAQVAFACADAIEDSDSPPTERYYTAVKELALNTNGDDVLRKLAAGLIRNQEAFLKAAAMRLRQWEAEQALEADMTAAELS